MHFLGAASSNIFSESSLSAGGGVDRFPIPNNYLIYLTINTASVLDYFRGGYVTAHSVQRLLKQNQIDISSLRNVLDFGCGCGRVIREIAAMTTAELSGCDYNPKLIHWCSKYLYCGDFRINTFAPPSPYADHSFDLIYSISVFTHIPLEIQRAWLKELHRITHPNGHVIITLHGNHLLPKLSSNERRMFEEQGYVEHALDAPGSNHFGTFHSRQYFEDMLQKDFVVVDFSQGGQPNHPYQDLYLLKRIQH